MTSVIQEYKNSLGKAAYRVVTKIDDKIKIKKFNPSTTLAGPDCTDFVFLI